MAGLLDIIGLGNYAGAGSGGLLDSLRGSSGTLTGLGAGLLSGNNWQSGLANGIQNANVGKVLDARNEKQKKLESATSAWLATQQGLDPASKAYLENNPEAAGQLFASKMVKPQASFGVIGEDDFGNKKYGWINPNDQSLSPAQGGQQQPSTAPQIPGFQPGMDPKAARAEWTKQQFKQGAAGEGGKPPSGFRWVNNDPASGQLEAIPGGPGTQLPAEVAGRIGLARNFIKDAGTAQMAADPSQKDAYGKTVRGQIEAGALDGVGGSLGLASGIGVPGQIGLVFESGKEALVRQMTGAGKSESEAKDYANRYSPLPTDSKERILWKLDHLNAELEASANEVGQGRGGVSVMPNGKRSTATGVQWSVEP